jgi:two-component system, sensor histidine kinase and response regulator
MNDHVTKPIDPEALFQTLLRWIAPSRLARPAMVAPAPAAPPPVSAAVEATLPAVAGVEWDKALASVDYKRERLYKRLRGFVQEYRQSPQVVRTALATEEYEPLQSLVHNLKSSAVYVGANALSALAGTIEAALRAGDNVRAAELAPELLAMLVPLLDELAEVEAPPAAPDTAPADLARLMRRLGVLLMADDAQADDVLLELQAALRGAGHDAKLAAVRRAVDDLEYGAALAALAVLARSLDIQLAEGA